MNIKKQRIKIAEFCGWWTDFPPQYLRMIPPGGDDKSWTTPPDYLNDLNEIHEAEKTLVGYDKNQMLEYLCILLNKENKDNPSWIGPTGFDYMHATAAQRSEALLRTIGKWEES
jgi:hypothetical protein